jgi:putative nucleotidyltransferase with HDIG domain
MRVPRVVKEVGNKFLNAGFQCYLVGGAVRNMVAGYPVIDYDLATDAKPEQVIKLFRRVIPTGIKHGTVTVLFKKNTFEVTTFRVESDYSDSRRPDTVAYTPSIYADLERRDFTINALALNLETNELLDPHKGIQDLKDCIIKAIGDPDKRFSEDALRMLRGCRFASQLGFIIEENTFEGIRKNSEKIRAVSAERIRDEFIKIVSSPAPSLGIEMMERTGLLRILLPELQACKGVTQKGLHRYDVYTHSLKSCDMADNELELRLAALFHDIGKTETKTFRDDGEIVFYRHEERSAELAREILQRLRFPRKTEKTVCHLIRHHMFNYEESWSDAAIRRFIARVGREYVDDLFRLRRADQWGMSGERRPNPALDELIERIDEVITEDNTFSVKDLAVNGNDLAEQAGIPRGPEMGTVLQFLFESVLEDPSLNNREDLLNIARNYFNEYLRKE